MAFTVTRTKTVMGNEAVVHMVVDADAATQTIETGLKNIVAITIAQASMATYSVAGMKLAINSNASGVQSFGVLGVSGVTSGDRFYVTVFGTR